MAAVRFPMSSPTAHIFAPPPQRAILQPSLHPRGGRPYVFSGEVDSVHAPGALIKNGATRCAVDAAFLVQQVLGEPKRTPAMWPGVPGVRERVYALGSVERADGLRPYAYQLEGAAFLAERDYALLLDEMGVGKTSQALLAAEARLSLASIPAPTTPVVLILCPALAKRHWQREVLKWTGYEAAVLESLTPTELPQNRYIIANYDILYGAQRRDAAGVVFGVDHLPGWAMSLAGRFLIVVADEAHMLRGRKSRRTLAVKAMCRSIPVFWALTGTPVPNYIRDLWALFDVITDGLQGFSYWDWAKRYCVGPATPMLLASGEYKRAGRVCVGDKLLGWDERTEKWHRRKAAVAEVLSVSTRWAPRYKLTMESGLSVVTSRDHRWFTVRSEPEFSYRSFLGERNRPLKKLAVAAPPPAPDITADPQYQIGYIRGQLDGDGHRRAKPAHKGKKTGTGTGGGGPSHSCVITGKDDAHLDRAFVFAETLGWRPKMSERRTSDGCRHFGFFTKRVYDILGQDIDDASENFRLGWLAGMYDAEGSYQNYFSQVVSEEKRNRIADWLHKAGFENVIHRGSAGVRFRGGRYAMLRFWLLAKPALTRKLQAGMLGRANLVHHTDRIVSCEELPPGRVVSIKTSTGNYIANGYMSKNCDATQAQYGWKDTGSSNLEELQARMSFFCLGRTAASVHMELPEKRREIFKIDVTVTAPTVHEGHLALTKTGFVAKALRRTAVAKRSAVVAQTLEVLEAKQKIVVFVYMREQADEIVKAVRAKIDCPVYCVHGDLSPDGRDAQATVFRNVQAPAAFVATIDSVAVAISLVGANLVLFADLVPEPWKLLQAEKRCHRHGSTERVLVRYLIGTGTLDEAVADTVIGKLATIEQALGTADDQTELNAVLGGGKQKDEEIIGSLFERLKALGGKDEGGT